MHAGSSERVVFVSHDQRARGAARESGLLDWDVLDLAKHWLEQQLVNVEQFRAWFVSWADDPHAFCRPKDFTDLDATFHQRYRANLDELTGRTHG